MEERAEVAEPLEFEIWNSGNGGMWKTGKEGEVSGTQKIRNPNPEFLISRSKGIVPSFHVSTFSEVLAVRLERAVAAEEAGQDTHDRLVVE